MIFNNTQTTTFLFSNLCGAAGLLALLFCVLSGCQEQRHSTLIDLQRQILTAQDEDAQAAILKQVDEYYLTLAIAPSLRNMIEERVAEKIKTSEMTPIASWRSLADSLENPFVLEQQFGRMLIDLMIAHARDDLAHYNELHLLVGKVANKIDSKLGNEYWQQHLRDIEAADANEAVTWLRAKEAEALCRRNVTRPGFKSDSLGALGLQYLANTADPRLRLDITQRLFFKLYNTHSLYDLAIAMARQEIELADEMYYHLRHTGMVFYLAEALFAAGRNMPAYEQYERAIYLSQKYYEIPRIGYYDRAGQINSAKVLWQLGKYEEALEICESIDEGDLGIGHRIAINNTRGITYVSLGQYDRAEAAYQRMIELAEQRKDAMNECVGYVNLGSLYSRLGERGKALKAFDKVYEVINQDRLGLEQRSYLAITMLGNRLSGEGDDRFLKKALEQANATLAITEHPDLRARLLRAMGVRARNDERTREGLDYLNEAADIFDENAALGELLETRLEIIKCLTALGENSAAIDALEKLLELAESIDDKPMVVEGLGELSQLAWLESDTTLAIQYSDQLLDKVALLNEQFADIENLVRFSSQVHQYLRNAVIYELESGNISAAHTKLEKIKGVKTTRWYENNWAEYASNDVHEVGDIASQTDYMMVNYFVTDRKTYAFISDDGELILLERTIEKQRLQKLVEQFTATIRETAEVLQNFSREESLRHYEKTLSQSQNLYALLLGWPELEKLLEENSTLYIIADQSLYGLPFACLAQKNEDGYRYLVERIAVANMENALERPRPKLAAFANAEDADIRVLVSADTRDYPEAGIILDKLRADYPLAEHLATIDANRNSVELIQEIGDDVDVLVIVGHSEPNLSDSDSSFINLAAINSSDSSLSVRKAYAADFNQRSWSNTKRVILVGCQTEIGRVYKGAGYAGLHRSFLNHGAGEILASLWEIDSREAVGYASQLMAPENTKMPSAAALQQIQIAAIEDARSNALRLVPHPYFWASLRLTQAGI